MSSWLFTPASLRLAHSLCRAPVSGARSTCQVGAVPSVCSFFLGILRVFRRDTFSDDVSHCCFVFHVLSSSCPSLSPHLSLSLPPPAVHLSHSPVCFARCYDASFANSLYLSCFLLLFCFFSVFLSLFLSLCLSFLAFPSVFSCHFLFSLSLSVSAIRGRAVHLAGQRPLHSGHQCHTHSHRHGRQPAVCSILHRVLHKHTLVGDVAEIRTDIRLLQTGACTRHDD